MIPVSCKKITLTLIILGMVVMPVIALPGRSSMPVPAPDSASVTVGPRGCDFPTVGQALAAVPAGSVLNLTGTVFTEAGIVLDKDVFIRGSANAGTIIQASGSLETSVDRVFLVSEGITVVLSDLTLRYGHPVGECPRSGGAIINYGTLWMERCILTDNAGQCAGGMENREGSVYAFDCMILRNEATSGVTEDDDFSMGSGGGIKNTRGTLYLENCTIAYNKARKRGGAIKNCCNAALVIRNCTVAGNVCASGSLHSKGGLFVDHCTFAFNRAPNSYAAGIFIESSAVIRNTIVAGNTMGDMLIELEDEDAVVQVENLWVGRDLTGVGTVSGDPLLGPLKDNGGFTWTCLLLPGSPAVDAATPFEDDLPFDQRGVSRPQGPAPDLGAVETGSR